MSEQRQRFLEDYQLNYYSISELAERFSISGKTAHTHPGLQGKWINRYKENGQSGFHERSRRPHSCPWQTDAALVEELVKLRKVHPHWGSRKLLDLMDRRDAHRELPSVSTGAPRLPENHARWSQRHLPALAVQGSRRRRSHRRAACKGSSANSTGSGRNLARSARTKRLG